jgi:hypothetical protein
LTIPRRVAWAGLERLGLVIRLELAEH